MTDTVTVAPAIPVPKPRLKLNRVSNLDAQVVDQSGLSEMSRNQDHLSDAIGPVRDSRM